MWHNLYDLNLQCGWHRQNLLGVLTVPEKREVNLVYGNLGEFQKDEYWRSQLWGKISGDR